MMKYEGPEFVEFLRGVLDFPRKGKIDPDNPNFAEVLNEHIAQASGERVALKPEIFYNLERPTGSQRRWVTTKKSYVPYQARTKDVQPDNSAKVAAKAKERKTLGPEKTAIDVSHPWLAGGPYTNPREKLKPEDCCYCWNAGKPCKYLTNDGNHCRKLHICMHENCRTLFHHGHRATDHNWQKL